MHSQGHEFKGKSVKFQVGRRGNQEHLMFCVHHLTNPDVEVNIRYSPKRGADAYYVPGKQSQRFQIKS